MPAVVEELAQKTELARVAHATDVRRLEDEKADFERYKQDTEAALRKARQQIEADQNTTAANAATAAEKARERQEDLDRGYAELKKRIDAVERRENEAAQRETANAAETRRLAALAEKIEAVARHIAGEVEKLKEE